jgi:hypothetical protein
MKTCLLFNYHVLAAILLKCDQCNIRLSQSLCEMLTLPPVLQLTRLNAVSQLEDIAIMLPEL